MADPRIEKFAGIICNSLDIVEDDVVLVWANEGAAPLILELQREILQRGAYPEIRVNLEQAKYVFFKYCQQKHLTRFPPGLAKEVDLATKLISIECITNPHNIKKISQERLNTWQHTLEPFYRKLDFIRSVVTIFPNVQYADRAGMSLEEYEKLFYNAVSVDLEKLYEEYTPIEQMLSRGNKFQVITSNTNLSFEIGDRNFTMNSLLVNFPDGEIYCAPLDKSVNGYIRFDHPPSYRGKTFENLYLEFKDGEVVRIESDTEQEELEKILAIDEGAKRMGEFGIGINPAIPDLTNDILFDEKIAGTFHIALGDSYPEVGGTNRSVIHFDMVKDMRGDGEILMDGRVIYREGCFSI